ncbi:hypothetical protein ACN47E_004458 [Coniothyrium glycines]
MSSFAPTIIPETDPLWLSIRRRHRDELAAFDVQVGNDRAEFEQRTAVARNELLLKQEQEAKVRSYKNAGNVGGEILQKERGVATRKNSNEKGDMTEEKKKSAAVNSRAMHAARAANTMPKEKNAATANTVVSAMPQIKTTVPVIINLCSDDEEASPDRELHIPPTRPQSSRRNMRKYWDTPTLEREGSVFENADSIAQSRGLRSEEETTPFRRPATTQNNKEHIPASVGELRELSGSNPVANSFQGSTALKGREVGDTRLALPGPSRVSARPKNTTRAGTHQRAEPNVPVYGGELDNLEQQQVAAPMESMQQDDEDNSALIAVNTSTKKCAMSSSRESSHLKSTFLPRTTVSNALQGVPNMLQSSTRRNEETRRQTEETAQKTSDVFSASHHQRNQQPAHLPSPPPSSLSTSSPDGPTSPSRPFNLPSQPTPRHDCATPYTSKTARPLHRHTSFASPRASPASKRKRRVEIDLSDDNDDNDNDDDNDDNESEYAPSDPDSTAATSTKKKATVSSAKRIKPSTALPSPPASAQRKKKNPYGVRSKPHNAHPTWPSPSPSTRHRPPVSSSPSSPSPRSPAAPSPSTPRASKLSALKSISAQSTAAQHRRTSETTAQRATSVLEGVRSRMQRMSITPTPPPTSTRSPRRGPRSSDDTRVAHKPAPVSAFEQWTRERRRGDRYIAGRIQSAGEAASEEEVDGSAYAIVDGVIIGGGRRGV